MRLRRERKSPCWTRPIAACEMDLRVRETGDGKNNHMRHQHRLPPLKAKWLAAIFLAATLPLAFAQYPGHLDTQKKAGPPLRAIAVLEWTGAAGKPSASRLIPIAVFDGENYQPGGLYLARPQPLALDAGTEYILQRGGVPQGLFDVNGAQEVQGHWLGYGIWREMAPPPMRKIRQGKNMPQVVRDADDGQPHFSNGRAGSNSSSPEPGAAASGSSGQNSTADSDRPVLVRRDSSAGSGSSGSTQGNSGQPSATGSGSNANAAPPVDPDRPVLVQRSSSTNNGGNGSSQSGSSGSNQSGGQPSATASGSTANAAPPVDPDRPVLRRRDASSPGNSAADLSGGPETAIQAPDPNRPRLTYGSSNPTESESFEEPKLSGNPVGLQRMIAVSDATDREPHPFDYSWANPQDAAKMKTQMEALAQKALAPAAKTPEKVPAAHSRHRTALARSSRKTPAVRPLQLTNERFAAYQLTYDSGATLVFSAQAAGATGKTQYVILVAQPDFYGVPHVIFSLVTEEGMLDLTPRMQLVDAVDAEGNSRGDLVFELLTSHRRQFGIYRVLEGQFQQVFVTGFLALSPGRPASSGS